METSLLPTLGATTLDALIQETAHTEFTAAAEPITFRLVHRSSQGGPTEHIEFAPGVSYLFLTPSSRLEPAPPESLDGAILFEPVVFQSQRRLLMVDPQGRKIQVNDALAPRIAMLAERDVLRIDQGSPMQVALYNRVALGPPPPGIIGKPCPICTTPLREDSRVWVCACGRGFHCEETGDEPLQCALSATCCPGCERPVRLEEGYITELDLSDEWRSRPD